MPKINIPSPATLTAPGINDIPQASQEEIEAKTKRRKRDNTADMLRFVRQDIQQLSNKLSDYNQGYDAGYRAGHTAGIHYIVNHAEEMMACHFKLSSRDELVSSGKFPSWWTAMLVELIKKSPPGPPPAPQAVSAEER